MDVVNYEVMVNIMYMQLFKIITHHPNIEKLTIVVHVFVC